MRVGRGDVLLGLAVVYAAPGIVEGICGGWDFVWLCGQHGEFDLATMRHAVRAAELVDAASVVRVPGHDYSVLGPFADLAPSALMVPMVNTVAEAEHIARSLRFPPRGNRSMGGRRPIDKYGLDYITEQPPYIIAQIETPEAVANAAAIAAVPDIDMLFFSPGDLRLHLGIPLTGDSYLADDRVRDAMAAMAAGAREAGKAAGGIATTPEMLETALAMGYQLINCGADCTFLAQGAKQARQTQYAALHRLSAREREIE
jgi:2-keto-3-deoxy-L-rhamnonate aldolase RhmA